MARWDLRTQIQDTIFPLLKMRASFFLLKHCRSRIPYCLHSFTKVLIIELVYPSSVMSIMSSAMHINLFVIECKRKQQHFVVTYVMKRLVQTCNDETVPFRFFNIPQIEGIRHFHNIFQIV